MTNQFDSGKNEITIKELLVTIKVWVKYLSIKWRFILFATLMGGVLGFIYSRSKPVIYTATTTFVLEEGKNGNSGLGGLASIAGQFGVDVSSSSGGGILSGDNILLYFKSPSLAREVLLSQFDTTSTESIADAYVRTYKLNEEWKKDRFIGIMKFPPINIGIKYTRLQDSLLQSISDRIIKSQFNVTRPDKKSSFIDVTINTENEILSKKYCERIVQIVIDRYINTKIQRQKATVDKLQLRLDSISNILQNKTQSGASLQILSNTMDINPLYKAKSNVDVETTLRDKTLLATIFASVTQNLEMAKFTLSQETPVIQIIDEPLLPLKKEKESIQKTTLLFAFGFGLFGSIYFIIVRIYKNL